MAAEKAHTLIDNVQLDDIVLPLSLPVNSRYILTVQVATMGETEDAYGKVMGRGKIPMDRPSRQHSFQTNQANRHYDPDTSTTCYSTGKFEKEILDLAGS